MRRRIKNGLVIARGKLVAVTALLFPVALQAEESPAPSAPVQNQELQFIENLGQWPETILFRLGLGRLSVALHQDGFAISRVEPNPKESSGTRGAHLRFRFESEQLGALPVGSQPSDGLFNFFQGRESSRWQSGAQAWQVIEYPQVWSGISVLLHEGPGQFEYDLALEEHADLNDVSILVQGADSLSIDEGGRLVMGTQFGPLVHTAPIAWTTDRAGMRSDHPCQFRLLGGNRFGFQAPEVPHGARLLVDPGVVWSTFLGHDDEDQGHALVRAPNGDVIIAGSTFTYDFPVTPGAFDVLLGGSADAYVTRFSSDGSTLIYSTFLGGSGSDNATCIDLATDGSVYVAGDTSSTDFPMNGGGHDSVFAGAFDGFVAHLNSAGAALLHSTYLGSHSYERVMDLVLDGNDRPVVAGSTSDGGFPVVVGSHDSSFNGGSEDGFVTGLSSDLSSLVFSTFVGGAGNERATTLAISTNGDVTLGGWTQSSNFPVTVGAFQPNLGGTPGTQGGFVAQFAANGQSLQWSTFLGGAQLDVVRDVVLLPNGSVATTGETYSVDFPMIGTPAQGILAGQSDGFVAILSSLGSSTQLVSSTYFGGTQRDWAQALCILPSNRLAVLGTTYSADIAMPAWVWDDGFGTFAGAGSTDLFINRYEADGSLSYSTYFGGGEDDVAAGLVGDGQGGVLFCGSTNSPNHPVTPGAFDTSYDFSGLSDAFVSHFEFVRFPFTYGQAKVHSAGGWAVVSTSGFPSLGGAGFSILADGALSNTQGLFFSSSGSAAIPFAGGDLLLSPPYQRTPLQQLGWLGSAELLIPIDASMVGMKRYYQFWYQDPNDPFGVGLSAGLEVLFYP